MIILQIREVIEKITDCITTETNEFVKKSWIVEHDGKRHTRHFDFNIRWDVDDSDSKFNSMRMLAGLNTRPIKNISEDLNIISIVDTPEEALAIVKNAPHIKYF